MDTTRQPHQRVYDGHADDLMIDHKFDERIVMLPDAKPSSIADNAPRLRIMWGQHLLDDMVAGRYRTLVCSVNGEDNSRGIITHLANQLPTSQWVGKTITDYARRFAANDKVSVLKYDMDAVEVLAVLRPAGTDTLRLSDLAEGFAIVSEMMRRKTERRPAATVSFLGGVANRLVDGAGQEPSFESVLRTMHEAGFVGDVYPAPWMWEIAPTSVYARYPFPGSVASMREGGF